MVRKSKNKYPPKDVVMARAEDVLAEPPAAASDLLDEFKILAGSYGKLYRKFCKTLVISDSYEHQTKDLTVELENTLRDLQSLKESVVPICMSCHKINTVDDSWMKLEEFFAERTDIMFSHGVCPDCVKQTYGKLGEKILENQKGNEKRTRPTKSRDPRVQDALQNMFSVVEQATNENYPLAPDIENIVNQHEKLLRRFYKIVSLSDSYQSQLRDFNRQLELIAHTDSLTGAYNRGFFIDLLNAEITRACRHDSGFSVLMMDMDKFKEINDTYGHAAGDEVLRSLSSIVQKVKLRKSDFWGRLGGEEFAIVLPGTNMHGAVGVAEKIRASLEKKAVKFKGEKLFVTASIGISEYKTGDTDDSLLQRADQAMYRAKEDGRNKVVF